MIFAFSLAYILVYKLPFILYGKKNEDLFGKKNQKCLLIILAAWRLIKSWLPKETQNSVIFVDEKTITDYIPADQIAEEIGYPPKT